MNGKKNPVTPTFVVLTLIALPFLAGGILGLVMPELVPPLASPKVAWSLIGVGIVMDLAAGAHLIGGMMQGRR